jgi:hypothetical protein
MRKIWTLAVVLACCTVNFCIAANDQSHADFVATYKQCSEANAQACITVGDRFMAGDGVPQNSAGAIRAYKRACELGLTRACALPKVGGESPDAKNTLGNVDQNKRSANAKLLIQRDIRYWAKYNNTALMDAVLSGNPKARDDADFKALYYFYQKSYFANCPQMVPKESPGIVSETTREEKYGPPTVISRDLVLVRKEYFKKFQEYAAHLSAAASSANMSSVSGYLSNPSNQSLRDMARTAGNMVTSILNFKQDLDTLVTDNDCDSGLQQQFSENLRRLAYDEPTLQQDVKLSVNYAAKDKSLGSFRKSLTIACYDHYKAEREARSWGGDFWYEHGKWCRCLDRQFTPMLSPAEMSSAIGNFKEFERSVTKELTSANDPAWPRVSAANTCKNP